jgi:alkanesulfonate monooxygenase SsuD/methylene tetrahydromethanopterin reductase-like flavin-dependent oxidoreductase (luciferase family)
MGYNIIQEHHNMPEIASSATVVLIGHIAAGTKAIRVGLEDHLIMRQLAVAEQFGTLATLFLIELDLIRSALWNDQFTLRH